MKSLLLSILAVSLLFGCAKQEQRQETSFTCSVEDVTTGVMTEKAGIFLYEYHTPSAPFSSLSRNVVEYFEVDYGSSFSYEFNAKRGNSYEYILEFDDFEGGFQFWRLDLTLQYEIRIRVHSPNLKNWEPDHQIHPADR